jgi:hypothetical protein
MVGFILATRRVVFILATGLAGSCNVTPTAESDVSATSYEVEKVYVKILEQETNGFLLSTEAERTEVGVCKILNGTSKCAAGVAGFVKAEKTATKDGRNFFKVSGTNIEATSTYKFIDQDF